MQDNTLLYKEQKFIPILAFGVLIVVFNNNR